ncbi:MAG: hypothetical protein ACKOXF_05870 [Chitinophagaceae bacterium]
MLDDNELKDMADKMELPLKEGAWEFIEAQIPVYPYRRRWILFWKFFSGVLIVLLAYLGLWYFNTHTNSLKSSTKLTNTTVPLNSNSSLSEGSVTTTDAPVQSAAPFTAVVPFNKKPASKKYSKSSSSSGAIATPLKTLISNDVNPAFSGLKTNASLTEISFPAVDLSINDNESSRYLALSRIQRYFKSISFNHDIVPRIQPNSKAFHYFIGMNYGVLASNIYIEPELMKLPKGEGSELSLYGGIQKKQWKFSLGVHSAQFRQTTSMGDQHDTTYMQVFRPNFETVLPSEYVTRLHDTASLYLSGTSHNKVKQNFKVFGLSLNISRTLFERGDFKMDVSYGANYKLLTKANTFFYDSINKAAVPFTQLDKGIVFKNLLSSRVRLAMNYRLYDQLYFEAAPFIDYFHKPFIKHYYKADFLNYGVSFGLNYTFK